MMVDAGQTDPKYFNMIPRDSFEHLRRSDCAQHRYFLGDSFESLIVPTVTTGAQLTPPRRFVISETERFLRIRSSTFAPLESLAMGGLGNAWGLGCSVYSQAELASAGLSTSEMPSAYQWVADRIGLSGEADDASRYTFDYLKGIDPAIPLNATAETVYKHYQTKRSSTNAAGFYMGRPCLALLTRARDGREPTPRDDMEFYSDAGGSAWRPWIALRQFSPERFSYVGNQVVVNFLEDDDGVRVECIDVESNAKRTFTGRKLVLATGALGSARIVLRSVDGPQQRVPLLCNPYTYLPSLVPSRFGLAASERDISLCQLALYYDPNHQNVDVSMGFIYAYRSLMMFRLLREAPISIRHGIRLLQYLMSGLLIVGIHHADRASPEKFLALEADPSTPTGDRLFAQYRLSQAEDERIEVTERAYVRALRKLRAFPFKRVRPGDGASIHYAGTLPFSESEKPLHVDPRGRLHGFRRTYIADGSGFTYLPAKGLTLSLMANAHLTALAAVRQ